MEPVIKHSMEPVIKHSMSISHAEQQELPKISIGLPVYNGEKFLRRRLDSLLAQTYTNFELIISDNASTDSTPEICKEYASKDTRIRYIRQKKNMGLSWNFNFVLQEAMCDYFVWAAADDLVAPEFLEKNIKTILSKKNLVGCATRVEPYELPSDKLEANPIDTSVKNFVRKLSKIFKTLDTFPLHGSYEEKIRSYLRKSTCQIIYGVYKTEILRKSIPKEEFMSKDWSIMLNVLRYGDTDVVDETLMYRYGSTSEGGMINIARHLNRNLLGILFPFYPFTHWCFRNLGTNLFLKNIDFFVQLNMEGEISLLIDVVRLFLHKIFRK